MRNWRSVVGKAVAPVACRRNAEATSIGADEVRGMAVAHFPGELLQWHVAAFCDELPRAVEPGVSQMIEHRRAEDRPKTLIESFGAEADGMRELVQIGRVSKVGQQALARLADAQLLTRRKCACVSRGIEQIEQARQNLH